MKENFTRNLFLILIFLSFSGTTLLAQINDDSPYPVDFEILAPSSIAGVYPYGTQATDGSTPNWGPTLNKTVSGEIAWGYTVAGDSLGCGAISTNLTGKIAIIRRGVCGFSDKVYYAQQAGAVGVIIANHFTGANEGPETVFGMLGGNFVAQINIPAIFVSRNTATLIADQLRAGQTVQGSFTIRNLNNPVGGYAYETPISQVFPISDNFEVGFKSADSTNAVSVTISGEITDPTGAKTPLAAITQQVGPLGDSLFLFPESFTPSTKGLYSVSYRNEGNGETSTARFVVGDFTYATDNLEIVTGVGPTAAFFEQSGKVYQSGSMILVGPDGALATHASFGIANADEVFTGRPTADVVNIILYDGDANNDGSFDFSASSPTFNDLQVVAFGSYTLTGQEPFEDLIYVPLEGIDPGAVTLKPNGVYFITILYDGNLANTGNAPLFNATNKVAYSSFLPITPLQLDRFYGGGWSNFTVVTRLHLDGFAEPTSVKQVLESYKIQLTPNPSTEFVQLQFQLKETADQVRIGILDVSGKVVRSEVLRNVRDQSYQFDVSRMPSGTYFFSITTPEGYRAEKFVVAH